MPPENEPTNQPESTSGGAGRAEQASVDSFKEFEKSQAALEAMADLNNVPEDQRPAPAKEEAKPEEKPATTEEKPEDKPEEKPAETTDKPESTTGEKPAEKPAEAAAKPGKKSARERIGELTKQKAEANREAQAERERADRAEAALRAIQEGKPAHEVAAIADPDAEPDPENFEYGTLDPKYQAAVRAYDKAQIKRELEASRQAEAAERAARELDEKFDAQVEALDSEVGDYVEKVVQGAQEKRWACSVEMGALIKGSDVGAKIAYHLASNPQESIALFHKSPIEQAAWFGRKEAEFAAPTGKPGKQAAAVPKAEAPAETVRGQGGKFTPNPATTDFSAFEKNFSHLLNQ